MASSSHNDIGRGNVNVVAIYERECSKKKGDGGGVNSCGSEDQRAKMP